MARHITFRGVQFNMSAFSDKHGETVSIGNSGRNARGDVLNSRGQVVATAKEVNEAYHMKNPKARSKVSINEDEVEKAARLQRLAGRSSVNPSEEKVMYANTATVAPAATVAPVATVADASSVPSQVVVDRKVFMDKNGEERTEITYADGSVEVV